MSRPRPLGIFRAIKTALTTQLSPDTTYRALLKASTGPLLVQLVGPETEASCDMPLDEFNDRVRGGELVPLPDSPAWPSPI